MMSPTLAPRAREEIYAALVWRNRFIGVLRVGVPVVGLVMLVVLLAPVLLASLTTQFGIGRVSFQGKTVSVDTPDYEGVLADGATYRITAGGASAALDALDVVNLKDAHIEVTKANGLTMRANAGAAALHLANQVITIPGQAEVANSSGTSGTLENATIDWTTQSLTTTGPAHFDLENASTIDAASMAYDAKTNVWTFNRATLTMPQAPGATQ